MPEKLINFLVILLVAVSAGASADTQKEIEQLLDFVVNTSCKYKRNGSIYGGIEAQNHIKKSTTTL